MKDGLTAVVRMEQAEREFQAALQRLGVQAQKAVAEWMPQEASLLARMIGSLTPPFAEYEPGRMTKEDQRVGIDAIRKDLLGRQRGQGIVRIATVEEIARARDFYQAIYRRATMPKGWEGSRAVAEYTEYYDPEGAQLARVHRANRRRSDGRVSQANRLKQVGVWKVLDQVWTTEAAFDRYVKQVGKRVGRGRKGWYLAARKFSERGWPGWVKKAPGGAGSGGAVDESLRLRDPLVRMFNATHVARRADTQTAIRRGLRERGKRLVRSLDAALRKRVR